MPLIQPDVEDSAGTIDMNDPGSAELPLVSVVLPAYNASLTVRETLESVLAQTYENLEVIVVDDGSTDDTWSVLKSFGSSIRAIRQQHSGIATCRNTGLHAASGEYVALMDSDDLCEPERIATQVEFLRRFPQVVLCSSDFSGFDAKGRLADSYCGVYYQQCSASRGGPAARYPQHGTLDISHALAERPGHPLLVPAYCGNVYEELVHGNFVHPPTVMFRRTLLRQVGFFDVDVPIVCEWDWLVKVARMGELGFIDRPLLRYRRSESQISASWRTPMDSLQVALRICHRDPLLFQREPTRFRRHFGSLSLDAADACVEQNPRRAIQLVMESILRYRTVQKLTFRILLKAVLPNALLDRIRRHRTS